MIFFLEKEDFLSMLGVLFLSDISLVVHVMALQSEQFYKCVVEMKAPGKAAQDQVGKAFNFQLLTDKGTERKGGSAKTGKRKRKKQKEIRRIDELKGQSREDKSQQEKEQGTSRKKGRDRERTKQRGLELNEMGRV